jgi:hypothetical protein
MRYFSALFIPFLILGLGPRTPSQAGTPNRTVVATHEVRVTVSIPRRIYPRDALVSVWIGLRNISHHAVYVPGACAGPTNPNVSVWSASRRLVYPPLIPVAEPRGPLVMACLAPPPRPLLPGNALHWRLDAVLRGSWIDARVGLGGPTDIVVGRHWMRVRLQVQLSKDDAPTLSVITSPKVTVDATAAPGAGPLFISEWWFCPGDIRANGARDRTFQSLTAARFTAPCARPTEWHGVAGRMGHSIARFDYVAPSNG